MEFRSWYVADIFLFLGLNLLAGRKLILAVGDIWPVFLAAQSRIPFIFIGTAKSEYYVRDERGPLQRRFEV